MRLSVCQVRRIVGEYNNSVDTVEASYDSDRDDDSCDLAEEEHFEISLNLYDAYESAMTSALIDAPVLFNVGFNGFEHVLVVGSMYTQASSTGPSRFHIDDRADLETDVGRDRFFRLGLEYLVIPALSEALATM